MAGWQLIDTAPKDGSLIMLLSRAHTIVFDDGEKIYHPPRVNLGKWWPEGDSWVDENGQLGGGCYTLEVTGVWESGGGWFQPNEVTHWHPLPEVPCTGEPAICRPLIRCGEGEPASDPGLAAGSPVQFSNGE